MIPNKTLRPHNVDISLVYPSLTYFSVQNNFFPQASEMLSKQARCPA